MQWQHYITHCESHQNNAIIVCQLLTTIIILMTMIQEKLSLITKIAFFNSNNC